MATDAELTVIGGRLCALLADEWTELLKARVLFAAMRAAPRSPAPENQPSALRVQALAAFDASLAALEQTQQTSGRIPPRLVDDSINMLPRKLDQRREERSLLTGG